MKPVVFLGPSLAVDEARAIGELEIRPPLRAGDLDRVPDGANVGVVDGLLDSSVRLAVSEVERAFDRGIRLTGAASTGILLAFGAGERMRGVGRIFDFLRDRQEIAEEMVVMLQRETDSVALTSPLINALLSAVDYWELSAAEVEDLIEKLCGIPIAERQVEVLSNFLGKTFWEKPVGARPFEIFDYKEADARLLLRLLVDENR